MACLCIGGCTDNLRARHFGGTMTVALPPHTKLVNAAWKEGNDLWYLTRPMEANEYPITSTFIESSSMGVFNGKVVFIETK